MRGVIPATILAELEALAGRPVHELFDLIAGTSTGGIIALGVASQGPGRKPLRAAELVRFYETEGPKIFKARLYRKVLSAMYHPAALERALRARLGDARLSEAIVPLMIPAYELQLRKPFVFKSVRAQDDADWDFLMRDAARATSAAPIYFPPAEIHPVDSDRSYTLVDGGIWANNPALCALLEARTSFTERPCHLLSIGTGEYTPRYSREDVRRKTSPKWAKDTFSVAMDSVSDAVHWQVGRLLAGPADRYVRLQPRVAAGQAKLDAAEPEVVEQLLEAARTLTHACREELLTFADVRP